MTAAQGVSWISLKAFIITGEIGDFALGLLITAIPSAIAGVFLWKFSDRIGQVSDQSDPAQLSANLTTDDLLEAGVFFVGVYAVLFGLVDAVGIEAADWMTRSAEEPLSFHDETLIRNWTRRAGYLLQIALGGGVIYYRHSLVTLSHKFRKTDPDS